MTELVSNILHSNEVNFLCIRTILFKGNISKCETATHLAFTCSKSEMESSEQCVKYVQS